MTVTDTNNEGQQLWPGIVTGDKPVQDGSPEGAYKGSVSPEMPTVAEPGSAGAPPVSPTFEGSTGYRSTPPPAGGR